MLGMIRTIGLVALFVGAMQINALSAGEKTRLASISLPKADRIVVLKSERQLIAMQGDRVLRVFRVALGRYPKGHKRRQGDAKTPEGSYTLDYKLEDSQFYRAIHVSYPNRRDRLRARLRGVDPGGKIMIHGIPNKMSKDDVGHPYIDWTQGCIAVTNKEMAQLWDMIDPGTPIEIHP